MRSMLLDISCYFAVALPTGIKRGRKGLSILFAIINPKWRAAMKITLMLSLTAVNMELSGRRNVRQFLSTVLKENITVCIVKMKKEGNMLKSCLWMACRKSFPVVRGNI